MDTTPESLSALSTALASIVEVDRDLAQRLIEDVRQLFLVPKWASCDEELLFDQLMDSTRLFDRAHPEMAAPLCASIKEADVEGRDLNFCIWAIAALSRIGVNSDEVISLLKGLAKYKSFKLTRIAPYAKHALKSLTRNCLT